DDAADDLNSHHRGLGLAEDAIWEYAHRSRPDDRFQAFLLHLDLLILHPVLIALDDGIDDLAREDGDKSLLDLAQGIGQYVHIEPQDSGEKGIVYGSGPYHIPSGYGPHIGIVNANVSCLELSHQGLQR